MIKFSLLNLLPPYIKNGARFDILKGAVKPPDGLNIKGSLSGEENSPPKNGGNILPEGYFPPKNGGSSLEAIGAFYARHEKAKSRSKKPSR